MDNANFDNIEKIPITVPERSHTQELLDTPIPIENRIELLSAYVIPTSKIHSLEQMAKKLGITPHRVRELTNEIGIAPLIDNGKTEYPLFTFELLEEELAWDATFESLEEYLSAKSIAKVVARDERWVKHRANELAIFPELRTFSSGREGFGYPKTLIPILRHVMLQTPLAGEWFNLSELEQEMGKSREWVIARLKNGGFTPNERVARTNHAVTDHFPPDSYDYLKRCLQEESRQAGDWLTMTYIARSLGRDEKWVKAHLEPYETLKEKRLDDVNKMTYHYPPLVYEALVRINIQTQSYEESGEYMTVKTLAQKIGRSVLWVKNRVDQIEATPETRRNRSNRLYEYYPPKALEQLRHLEN